MKKILIISPHFPPSNLAAVHRSRLFAMHLPKFGWEPIILTVHEKYYEEELDWNLAKLLPKELRIEKVKALPTKPIRIVGDIGIRGFIPLLFRTIKIIKKEKIDFLYIPIPSNYTSLIGRIAKFFTGIKYGIDYIDPWVHKFPGSEVKYSKHWFAMKLADILEPIAVKKVSLITGVAEGYYNAVIDRNPHLKNSCIFAAMPYGGEAKDHEQLKKLELEPYLFKKNKNKFQFVYAGAMLPKAFEPLKRIFESLASDKELCDKIEIHFIGTGKHPNDAQGFNIKTIALEYGLWEKVIYEYPKRIPYLDVLVHLQSADGVFILGSTEPHYTPSKVYQGVLSEKPILAVLHSASTAVEVIRKSKAGLVLDFNGEPELDKIKSEFNAVLKSYLNFAKGFNPKEVDHTEFEKFSAYNVTGILAEALNKVIDKK